MTLGPAFDAKEQVRQAVDIVDLVGSYIPLRRQGRNFVGLCKWHDDSRPSLNVNPDRQSWRCWVCDIGGDVFSFIMKAEGLEFREALELLAERAGIKLHSQSEPGCPPPRPDDDKRSLYRLLAWAEEQFHRCLLSAPEGEPGRHYLTERKITPDSAKKFHIGYAPQRWDWLLERARQSEWRPALLERAGLLRRREQGEGHYDWFRGRVMFSIRDTRSRPVAFGGRVLPQLADEHAAKYINSPETALFSKSRELYGLDVARENFQRAGGAVIMEGYTDVVVAHQNGLDNAVAVLGTALGERHLQVLRRYTDSITLVLDGDDAGRRRTNEILDALLALFEKNEVDLRILTLPEGLDPCDFIATHGSDPFRALLAQAVDALEHKFKTVTNGLDTLTDTHRASQAAEQLLGTLAQIRPADGGANSTALLREEQMLGRIARQFHLPEEKLRSRLSGLRRAARRRGTATSTAEDSPPASRKFADIPAWDRELLELVLLDPNYITRIEGAFETNPLSPVAQQIFDACRFYLGEENKLDFGRLLAAFDDADVKGLLVQLDESAARKATADRERWLADLIDTHHRRRDEGDRRRSLAAAQQNTGDAEQLLAQFLEQSKTKHRTEYERRKK